jgi:hypothetical protein
MPFPAGPASPDAQLAALRHIAEGEPLPADHDAAMNLSSLGHAEHDGNAWALTAQGEQALEQATGGAG